LALLLTVINNIISFLITLAIVFVAPIMIAWAGFLLVVNQGDTGKVSEARGILLNTVIGIVIALAGWMIVDALMSVLYNGNFGAWNSIVTGGDICINQAGSAAGANLNQAATTGTSLPTTLSSSPGSPCNPATITAAVPSAFQAQAQLLACIAQGESTCGTKNPPYNLNSSWGVATANGKASSAAGAYQVLLSSNHSCYENSACYTAAGVTGPLNCQNAFDANGFPIPGATLTNCETAAGNVACSAAAAVCNLNNQTFQAAYATDPYMSSCQAAYGSG
jgi:hypothetical protein